MDHPGVKTLLDRIFKQQKPTPVAASSLSSDQSNDKQVSLKKFNEIDLSHSSNANNSTAASFTRLTDFKETLKQRMKARRCQIRKEEEEDNEMDEEYHIKKKDDEDEESDELNNNNKDVKTISDDDDDEDDENESAGDDSDSDFKLNLNDDEDEENEDAKTKKVKKSTANKISCYDFDEEDEDLPDLRSKKKDKEIPLTNSIPSNQLTKVK